jgi:uncharacterized peroxidase-related enzyme
MSTFKVHTIESAPLESQPLLEGVRKSYGMLPNLFAVMAESSVTTEAYLTLAGIFDKSTFSDLEKQIVLLTVSMENGCNYCVAAHSMIADMQKLPTDVVDAIRNGEPISDNKLEALRRFTGKVVVTRGRISEDDIKLFRSAGYSKAQLLEVLLGVAWKTLSNYLNHIAETPLDTAFKQREWHVKASA